jgi:hypothetical protein
MAIGGVKTPAKNVENFYGIFGFVCYIRPLSNGYGSMGGDVERLRDESDKRFEL